MPPPTANIIAFSPVAGLYFQRLRTTAAMSHQLPSDAVAPAKAVAAWFASRRTGELRAKTQRPAAADQSARTKEERVWLALLPKKSICLSGDSW